MSPANHFAIKEIAPSTFQLVHRASKQAIQRHNVDFTRVSHAAKVRDAMLEAAPDWDFSEPSLFEEMPPALFEKVWAAIYSAG